MDLSMATCNAEKAQMKSSEYRKVIKPLLERRRRARINSCLDELKALILESAQNENTDASKLEKADILELTVQHLRTLRRQSRSSPVSSPVAVQSTPDKFRSGFAECAHEVSSFISALGGVETHVKSRLITHLSHCINRIPVATQQQTNAYSSPAASPARMTTTTPVSSTTIQHHQYGQTGAAMTLNTPTPPPSPVSPYQQCGSPTVNHHQNSYTVPVSPVSPAGSPSVMSASSYHKFNGGYGSSSPSLRGEVYVWPDIPSSNSDRRQIFSPVDTQYSDDSYYQRDIESPSPYQNQKDIDVDYHHHQQQDNHKMALAACNEKPWRPW